METLTSIRRRAIPNTFPIEVLSECVNAISFFSSAFLGANDVIHLYDAGLREIWINDIEEKKLAEMANIYSLEDYSLPGDAFSITRELFEADCKVDLVVSDPGTDLMDKQFKNLDSFLGLSRKYAILGVSIESLRSLGANLNIQKDQVVFNNLGMERHVLLGYKQRSMFKGGIFWAVFKSFNIQG